MMHLEATIPANSRAIVTLPGAVLEQVTESGLPLSQVVDVTNPVQAGPDARLDLGSGAYHFTYPVS